jgi:hypothetical protein
MIVLLLIFVLPLAVQSQSGSTDSPTTMQHPAHEEYERHRQAAIHINGLAERTQSEADANDLVSEIAAVFSKELPPAWLASGINQRVANAEYQSVRNDGKRVSEQRIVDVWNQYVHEIGAPDEALVTAAEIHNLRDAELTVAKYLWARGSQTIWTVPNIYALGTDGKVGDGCRAIEAIRVIYDLDRFQNLRAARDRIRRGVVASEEVKHPSADSTRQPHRGTVLVARADDNPVRSAEGRYLQEHGPAEYEQLLNRLFDELFPAE